MIVHLHPKRRKQGSVGVEKPDNLFRFGFGNKGLAIIQIQGLADLNEKRMVHRNTKYYDKWNKNIMMLL